MVILASVAAAARSCARLRGPGAEEAVSGGKCVGDPLAAPRAREMRGERPDACAGSPGGVPGLAGALTGKGASSLAMAPGVVGRGRIRGTCGAGRGSLPRPGGHEEPHGEAKAVLGRRRRTVSGVRSKALGSFRSRLMSP